MSRPIKLRTHHLVCVHGFRGKGYSPEFVQNFWDVIERLGESDSAKIEIVGGTDDLCKVCPRNERSICTDHNEKTWPLDQAYNKTLGVKPGDTLTWGEVKDRVAARVSNDVFEKNCELCTWKAEGVCKKALESLRKTQKLKSEGLGPVAIAALTAAGLGLSFALSAATGVWLSSAHAIEAHTADVDPATEPALPPAEERRESNPKIDLSPLVLAAPTFAPAPPEKSGTATAAVGVAAGGAAEKLDVPPVDPLINPPINSNDASSRDIAQAQQTQPAPAGSETQAAGAAVTGAGVTPPTGTAVAAPGAQEPITLDLRFASIEVLEQKIMNDKKRRIQAIFDTQKALDEGKFDKARKTAKKLERNEEYTDYFHFLTAEAEHGRLRDAMKKKQWANALFAGEQSVFHFVQLQGLNPSTALSRRAAALQGEVEVSMAECYLKRSKKPKAREMFERGFQRLAQINMLGYIPKQSIVTYAMLCEKNKNEMCTNWVARLAPLVAKEEAAILARVGLPKRPYIEKTTSVPYRVDLDMQAFDHGWKSYIEGNYDQAFVAFTQLLRDYPRTNIKLRTKFWMARAAHKSDHPAHAETLYREIIRESPFSYYGLLSSWYANIDLSRMMDAEFPIATSESALLSPAETLRIRRAEALLASSAPELALYELSDIRPSLNMTNEFLVYLAALNHLAGNHLATFLIFGELSSRNFQGLYSSYGQRLLFPTEKLPEIRTIAKEWKVDPLIVLSIIKQESAFNAAAVSGANAYGLMQIISPTARDLDPKVEMVDLLDPSKNVRLGAKYVARLLAKYNGNLIPVLAAYNAGPTHSDRWLRDLSSAAAPEEYIEQITFRETREYVQSVLRNYYWYSRRVKHETFPHLQALLQSIAGQAEWSRPVRKTTAAFRKKSRSTASANTRRTSSRKASRVPASAKRR